MTSRSVPSARCAALVGPYTSGKTTLLEALLLQTGAIHRKGSVVEGSTVGDAVPEARARQMSTEPNFAHCDYLGETWSFIDCPGSLELAQDTHSALMGVDVAVVVASPEPERALTLAPIFKFLDDYQIPHILFVNKMDKATVRVRDLLEALQSVSDRPLVLRQVPIREGEEVTGFVDLVSERAWRYKLDKQSELIEMPEQMKDREAEARQELLESLADFDDGLLEQLLEDKAPAPEEIYEQIGKDLAGDLIVPVLFGSAEQGHGITRLLKTLRHDAPEPAATAARLGVPQGTQSGEGLAASVIRTYHAPHTGKMSISRIWRGGVKDGDTLGDERISGLYRLMGGDSQKIDSAGVGELVALGRMDAVETGDLLTEEGRQADAGLLWPETPKPVFSLAIRPHNRQDEVKLTASLGKLTEEDPSLVMEHNDDTNEMLLRGQGDIHLKLAVDRLKNRYNVEVDAARPQTAYKETIRKSVTERGRHKKQTGGHGQFGDVVLEIRPLPRGEGFAFSDTISGGVVPKQYIPAVEAGVREYMQRGPLGFPVVDIAVTLTDGSYHTVDSSEQAFKAAARLAMSEGMAKCSPVLLEPVVAVEIHVPQEATSKVNQIVSGRRGQILGFDAREGWSGWDTVRANMSEGEIQNLIVEIRSATAGVGTFTFAHDHMAELTGKMAEEVLAAKAA